MTRELGRRMHAPISSSYSTQFNFSLVLHAFILLARVHMLDEFYSIRNWTQISRRVFFLNGKKFPRREACFPISIYCYMVLYALLYRTIRIAELWFFIGMNFKMKWWDKYCWIGFVNFPKNKLISLYRTGFPFGVFPRSIWPKIWVLKFHVWGWKLNFWVRV